ncbi:MAG: enoyl-CoA hydratase/isomerase family protein [Chloroflexi bacterium]|nr:enoyl-CoA hydratase/isomerase family protein [Chloroflexota bacterium]
MTTSPTDVLQVEITDYIAVLTLNRPQVMNALDRTLAEAITRTFPALDKDPAVRVAILTGAGPRAFCAGADLKERATMTPEEVVAQRGRLIEATNAVLRFEKPLIAAINGLALGGGLELALACDFALAAEGARFGFPETTLAIIPGDGGTQLLPRVVGQPKARELIFTGEIIDAAEALRLGLVTRVVPADALLPAAREIAAKIARNGPIAVRQAKRALNMSREVGLSAGFLYEQEAYQATIPTEDRTEALRAFAERRPPNYQGR